MTPGPGLSIRANLSRRPRGILYSRVQVVGSTISGSIGQGQRPLKRCSDEDFQQEVVAPTATPSLHGEALAAGMLLQQGQRQAIQPGEVLTQVLISNPRLILAVRDVESPVAAILDAPMAQVLRTTIGRFGDPANPDNRLPRSGSGLGRASMV